MDSVRGVARRVRVSALCFLFMLTACSGLWNNPYPPAEVRHNVLFESFDERPQHLDPARSYNANEYRFIANIYEPPLQYHYLKRPYTLIPLAATEMPKASYYDAVGHRLPDTAIPTQVAYTVYEIHIKPGMMYQPHPALAINKTGEPRYRTLSPHELRGIHVLDDFLERASREVTAADYIHEIKRLAHPQLLSPIAGIMSQYIVGFPEYMATLQRANADATQHGETFLDVDRYTLSGVELVDRYTYRIKIKGVYPQFLYWLTMPFFAPVPPEADRFYAQVGMAERNISLDWYPLGSGPYMLTVNNPNRQMVMERNPNFHGESYPRDGAPEDAGDGLLNDAGQSLPFVDKVVYSLEKESIPYWNKFLQGYYDTSGVSSDSFDQAIRVGNQGEVALTEELQKKGIKLATAVEASTMYIGFNMLDPVVGGSDDRARKLRRAISIAIDYEEYISIFLNGRGIAAQGPIPPGIFGYKEGSEGINPYVYGWENGAPKRKSIDEAKRLLSEAGYPNGIDTKTGAPLLLHLDIPAAGGGPDAKATLDWYRKQLAKINIELDIRSTQYNRFQEKMAKGTAQIFTWGWNADYPDPENFLFLLYGPNGQAQHQGENAANYDNSEFDRLFEQVKSMPNGRQRQAVVDQMLDIVRRDAPWIWGFHPKGFGLYHAWYQNAKPNLMANNTLKYVRVNPALRVQRQLEWNQPVLWPLALVVLVLVIGTLPAVSVYRRRLRTSLKRQASL